MDKKPMTAGEIAGRLAAKKIEPLVDYVERVTGVSQCEHRSKVRVFRDDYSVVVERNLEYVRVTGGCETDVA